MRYLILIVAKIMLLTDQNVAYISILTQVNLLEGGLRFQIRQNYKYRHSGLFATMVKVLVMSPIQNINHGNYILKNR